ncbi:hypothetical protein H0H92_000736 [Tricholoma furcatifolium]|nr:hypothetical protein H0H92_000736 [Tricholoma furcatifolium]
MPSLPSDITTEVFSSAKQLPAAVWKVLGAHPRTANVTLPYALRAKEESHGHRNGTSANLWIVCSTGSTIEFILSVTDGSLGANPVFIFTSLPFDRLSNDYIRPCMQSLAIALDANSPRSRIFSVFSFTPVTLVFAEEWTRHTGIQLAKNPVYYAAKLSYCTIQSLNRPGSATEVLHERCLRPGEVEDIEGIGELNYFFANDAVRFSLFEEHWRRANSNAQPPFTLTKAQAQLEAAILVQKNQVWVHEALNSAGEKEIASIVAFTRNSDQVAAITKVVTNKRWQRRGCAERLVRRVCEQYHSLLTGPDRKESVVLYVAHDNKAANVVYDRVGFRGLSPNEPKVEGVDSWLELGFDREKVVLGHCPQAFRLVKSKRHHRSKIKNEEIWFKGMNSTK